MRSLLFLLLVGCAVDAPSELRFDTGAPAVGPLSVGSVSYALTWATEGVEQDGDGWKIATNLGYSVHVQSARAVMYHASLSPCEAATTASVSDLVFGQVALADHPAADDPSAWVASLAESAMGDETARFGPIEFDTAEYCGVHWLIARGDEATEMEGVSLEVSGTWTDVPGASGSVVVQTNWADGRLLDWDDLREVAVDVDGPVHLDVEVERDAARLFDDIAFSVATQNEVDWLILENLLDHSDVAVVASPL